MDTDIRYKNRIGQRLTGILINGYEDGTLTSGQVSFIATVIREEMEKDMTSSEVLAFVEELAEEYPLFNSVLTEPKAHTVKNVNRRYLEQMAGK